MWAFTEIVLNAQLSGKSNTEENVFLGSTGYIVLQILGCNPVEFIENITIYINVKFSSKMSG